MSTAFLATRSTTAATDPLLDHAMSTPDRLEVNESSAEITLVVSNGGTTRVRCAGIVVEFPVGTRPRDLATTGTGITAEILTEGWTKTGESATPSQARFEFRPTDGPVDITTQSVSFKFTRIGINAAVGVAYPRVIETSATGQDEPVDRPGFVRLPKFPGGASSQLPVGSNLRAYLGENPSAAQSPVAQVPHGSTVTVKWNHATGVVRHLHYQNQDSGTPIDAAEDHLVCGPLCQDTTFTLQTVSQTGGEQVTRYDSLTITVDTPAHPKLTLPNGRLDTPAASELRITSAVRAADTLTVRETAAFLAATSVDGVLSAPGIETADVRFAGTFTTTGTFTANNLTAPTVTSTNGLTVTGKVQILKDGSTNLGRSGTHTVPTDGFLIACFSGSESLTLSATVGETKYESCGHSDVGGMVVPVQAGQTVTFGVDGNGGTAAFHWYALGR